MKNNNFRWLYFLSYLFFEVIIIDIKVPVCKYKSILIQGEKGENIEFLWPNYLARFLSLHFVSRSSVSGSSSQVVGKLSQDNCATVVCLVSIDLERTALPHLADHLDQSFHLHSTVVQLPENKCFDRGQI